MNTQIEWISAQKLINKVNVAEIEELLGIKLPEDFVTCALKNNGGYPVPNMFYSKNGKEEIFNNLLSFDSSNPVYMLNTYNSVKDRLIERIYPFAEDPGGNLICFDYRESNLLNPKVVLWDHEVAHKFPEKAISYVCNTFTELLNSLHEE